MCFMTSISATQFVLPHLGLLALIAGNRILLLKIGTSFFIAVNTPERDPVCSLSSARKLRLCSNVFSEETLRKEVRFSPIIDNVQLGCVRKTISIAFLNRFLRRPFEEWVIGCKATHVTTNNHITYYVSRAHSPNTIYVYIDAFDQKLSLYNFYYNASVVTSLRITIAGDRNRNNLVVLLIPVGGPGAPHRRRHVIREDVED